MKNDLRFLADETVLRSYESIRSHVAADTQSGGPYRFMGLAATERANALLEELRRRRLAVSPIDWPHRDDSED